MKLVGANQQQVRHPLFDATVALTGSAQLVLPVNYARSFLMLQNLSAHSMAIEIGSARATATLTNGAVSSLTITNAGFGMKAPPIVEMIGGGFGGNTAFSPAGMIAYPNPQGGVGNGGTVARVRAVLTSGAVTSFVIDDGGFGYQVAPYVLIRNSDLDPFGAPIPALASAGIILPTASAPIVLNGTCCPTDAISVIGTTSDVLLCKWMD